MTTYLGKSCSSDFTLHVFCERLSVCGNGSFHCGFEGEVLDFIVHVY